jgi:hypothetical protein
MTCIGFSIDPGGRRAVAFSDSEVYRFSEPAGFVSKLIVNPLALTVGMATGPYDESYNRARAKVASGQSFDGVCLAIQSVLLEDMPRKRSDLASRLIFCVVGYSASRKRIIGAAFSEAKDFDPVFKTEYSSPAVEMVNGPMTADALQCTVHAQWMVLGKPSPASGGHVAAAEITPHRITCGSVFDLTRERALPGAAHVLP